MARDPSTDAGGRGQLLAPLRRHFPAQGQRARPSRPQAQPLQQGRPIQGPGQRNGLQGGCVEDICLEGGVQEQHHATCQGAPGDVHHRSTGHKAHASGQGDGQGVQAYAHFLGQQAQHRGQRRPGRHQELRSTVRFVAGQRPEDEPRPLPLRVEARSREAQQLPG